MKNQRLGRIAFVVLIIVALLVGCAAPPGQPAPTPTPAPTPVPTPTPMPEEEPPDDEDAPDIEMLSKLFPEREGYRWVYFGFAEYGHEMTIEEISVTEEGIIYTIPGEVFDMSDGESDRAFTMTVTYTIVPGAVFQDKREDVMMDSDFDHIELVRGPLEEGNSWIQILTNAEGNEFTLKCTITEVTQEEGVNLYTIEYQDQNGPYYERRVIKEGIGVVSFAKLYMTDEDDFEVSYHFFDETSGYQE